MQPEGYLETEYIVGPNGDFITDGTDIIDADTAKMLHEWLTEETQRQMSVASLMGVPASMLSPAIAVASPSLPMASGKRQIKKIQNRA